MNKKIVFTIIVLAIAFVVWKFYPQILLYWQQTEHTINSEEKAFYVRTGITLDELEQQLIDSGIIKEKSAFRNIADYKELNDENIGAGKYLIKKNYKVSHLINGFKINSLGNGNGEVEVRVTFNNCRDLEEMAGLVSRHIEADSLSIIQYLLNPEVMRKYGFDSKTFSAMFIPDTYNMFWDTDAESFVARMAEQFKRFWTPERSELAKGLNMSQSKIVTLASVVYAEQSLARDEWPIIAGLYLNRIKLGMRLESDPTFKFCWGRALSNQQRLYDKHREIDCEYNTYKIYGLPPGPINFPPAACVDAVLRSKPNDYVFMCAQANNSGKHVFTKSYDEHLKNSKAFREWLNAQGIR